MTSAVSFEQKGFWGDFGCMCMKPLLAAAMTGCYD